MQTNNLAHYRPLTSLLSSCDRNGLLDVCMQFDDPFIEEYLRSAHVDLLANYYIRKSQFGLVSWSPHTM